MIWYRDYVIHKQKHFSAHKVINKSGFLVVINVKRPKNAWKYKEGISPPSLSKYLFYSVRFLLSI